MSGKNYWSISRGASGMSSCAYSSASSTPGNRLQQRQVIDDQEDRVNKFDVAVVGSGGAALSAALAAAGRGAKVVVLERAPVFGGTTAISGGGMWMPGNRFMAENGQPESIPDVKTYLRHCVVDQEWSEPLID